MVEVLVGAGGWGYFQVPGDRLREYARAFRTVEVNSTYYLLPPLARVEGWKKRVPDGFEFSVRCSRELERRLRSGSLESCLEVFYRMREICLVLDSDILHILTPSGFVLDEEVTERISGFLEAVRGSGQRIAWEARSPQSRAKDSLVKQFEEHGIIHSVDLSRERPAYRGDVVYSRLFGKGEHNIYQFTNDELRDIDDKARNSGATKIYLNFHGTRMYRDAARISIYEATGRFPKVTRGVGVDSVLEVLGEDARFPATTSELVSSQGWKVCEWSESQQLRVSDVFSGIGERSFNNISDVRLELRRLV